MKPKKIDVIYKSDCTKILADTVVCPNNSVDLIMTSPPYAERRRRYYQGVPPGEYVDWFLPISKELYRILKPDGSIVLNMKEHVNGGERQTYVLELVIALREQGWLWVEEYCWYKKNSYPGKWPNRFRDNWERCLHFTKQKKFKMYQDSVKVPIGEWSKKRFRTMCEKDLIRSASGTNRRFARNVSNWLNRRKVYPHNVLEFESEHYIEPSTVIRFATECRNRNHSAVFPVELPSWFIKLFTRKGNIVLDPFIGVGTTALAAMLLDRRFIGMEVSGEFVKEAKKNICELEELLSSKHS